MSVEEKHVKDWQTYKGQRSTFESLWQSCHDYYYVEADDINTTQSGQQMSNILYDSTTLEAADISAAGFMSYLTPPTSKWFSLRARSEEFRNNKKIDAYFEDVAREVNSALNRSNFYDQMPAIYKSSLVYGTSVLLEEEDQETDIRFLAVPLKQVCLVEDSAGRVKGYYIEFQYTADQAAEKFGEKNLSDDMQKELKGDKACTTKHTFLLYISKRYRLDVTKKDRKNMPIESRWIDAKAKKTVDEGGYREMPIMCHRFDKRPSMPWGFSPGMKTLPFARQLNAIAKTSLRAMMKGADPAIAVPDNAFIMPFNQNPRYVNYYRRDMMPNGAGDIFAIGNKGNPEFGMKGVEYYTMQVKSMMYNDVFMAFSQITKEMNNPEVAERINEKMTLLGPSVGRCISEINNPVIIRTIGILQRRGRLPEPPQELIDNPGYEIDCVSQLAQAQRRGELNALLTSLQLAGQVATYKPDVMDRFGGDQIIDEIWDITGATTKVFLDDEQVAAIRDGKEKAALAQQKLQMMQQGADIIKAGSEVDANLAAAGQTSVPK